MKQRRRFATDSTHWRTGRRGEDVIAQVRRRLHHATGVARGAYASAFAGEGHEVVVSTVAAGGAGKAVDKDAAFGVFAKRLAHIWLGGAVIALSVELACTGELKPCFVAPEHPKAVELNG